MFFKGSAIVLPSFSPELVLDAMQEHDATLMFGVPTMWVRMLASPRVDEIRRLRLCVSGSAPLASSVWAGLNEVGGQQTIERYGMTETVMLTSNPLNGDRRAGSVGLALPGVEVRLAGYTVDGIGEIEVRGPNVFAGYLDSSGVTDTLTEGWFSTGDLGRVDPQGYLYIVGRSKDLIISGGYNVYPNDVEEVIRTHPKVFDAAVVGEPNDEWGEIVVAFIIVTPTSASDEVGEVGSDELLAFCRKHLANYQAPKRVVLVNEFPRNALGKVVKSELRRSLAENK